MSLADLDDDGFPEVFMDGAVWSSSGVRMATLPGYLGFYRGAAVALADVDDDGAIELIGADGTWQWNGTGFALDPSYAGTPAAGFAAFADFGDFPGAAGDAPGRPEIVLSLPGEVRLQSIGGTVLASHVSGGMGGGPPTIADYDGDGAPEIGVAYGDRYEVWDPAAGGALWSQASQDVSSRITGSSVFDFNGDGRAEVVYGDECYVRIYDGTSGSVLFSQSRFSSTWQENPIVADVDADSAAEIVMPMSGACVPTYCPAWDPIFAGLACTDENDCPGGPCEAGLCRCVDDAQCGATYACTEPLPGTGGASVCRSRHDTCSPGLRVYRDRTDGWARSRAIWNQHAYHVTNVDDDGTVPRTSQVQKNWAQSGLNNFRQNVQGAIGDAPGSDLTASDLAAGCLDGMTEMRARICNRGGALLDGGVTVIFRQVGGNELCRLVIADPIPGGACTMVGCVAPVAADGAFEAVVDPDGIISECVEGNNTTSADANCIE